jgi:DNA-binding IclR family transcriptional regulator
VGQPFPLHSSGLGKALLAFAEPGEVDRILARPLKAYTPMTIVDPDKLKTELAEVRQRGYAQEREETFRGIMCLAAPVLGPGGTCVGAVSLPYPTYVEEELDLAGEIGALLSCTREGSAALGFESDHRPA